MSVIVTTRQAFGNGNTTTYNDGTVWDVDPYGNLEVFNGTAKIGTHASGEWSNARTAALATAGPGRDNPGRTISDSPQA